MTGDFFNLKFSFLKSAKKVNKLPKSANRATKCPKVPKNSVKKQDLIVSVLLSALVERDSVYCMRDFLMFFLVSVLLSAHAERFS